jgi:hypothetical protein
MSFDPLLFCEFAQRISSEDQSEVALRTSVGRAYYGVYLIFREKLKGRIKSRDLRKRPHASVIEWVRKHHRSSGDQLAQLFDLRVQADYQLENPPPYDNWLNKWDRARTINQRLISTVAKII